MTKQLESMPLATLRRESPRKPHRLAARVVLVLAALTGPLGLGRGADEPLSIADHYGFLPVEVYKVVDRAGSLIAADLDSDGRKDLLLVNNSNSRLELLRQRDKPDASVKPSQKVNAIEDGWRFERKTIGLDRAVSALAVGDLNGDGKLDIACAAPPDQLIVRMQSDKDDWEVKHRLRIPDLLPSQWTVAIGDVNGDKLDDLVALAKGAIYVFHQQPKGELQSPVRLSNTTENLGLIQIADIDGDGRNDLAYLANDDVERPFCIRLQNAEGRLGAEIHCELPKPRGVTLANVDGKPGVEIAAIENQTGRVKLFRFDTPPLETGAVPSHLLQYGFGNTSNKNRDLAVGDVTGDGRADVLLTDPDTAQIILHTQMVSEGLDLGTPFASLDGVERVRIADLDGDKKPEIVVFSAREKILGISKPEGGRIGFPATLSIDKEPLTFELADVTGDKQADVVYITRERTSGATKYLLQAVTRAGDRYDNVDFGGATSLALPVKSTPENLLALDANQDGRTDFLVFAGSEPPLLILGGEGNKLSLVNETGVGLGNVSPGSLFLGELDGPVFLMAQNNYARSLGLTEDHKWKVLDQFNAAEVQSKVQGVVTLELDGKPGNEIVLIDLGVKKLRVMSKQDGRYQPWKEVEIGAFPFKSAHVADFNGDGRQDLLLFGVAKFGVLYAGQPDARLEVLSTFETKLEDVRFSDLVVNDLNGDGQSDVALLDVQSQYLEILDFPVASGLRHALQFKVFEAKVVGREEQRAIEPREIIAADVTGDGREDLILLSHDRILVYPQDTGEMPATAAK